METVTVIYHCEDGTWWAEAPRVPGWTAAADSLNELTKLAEEGVRFALEREDVVVDNRLAARASADIVFDFVSGVTLVRARPKLRASDAPHVLA
jgi:predicted RNase H-like HicB family nuclease